jgi:hypothetical protein
MAQAKKKEKIKSSSLRGAQRRGNPEQALLKEIKKLKK